MKTLIFLTLLFQTPTQIDIRTQIDALLDKLVQPPAVVITSLVSTPAALDAAISSNVVGATIQIDPSLIYPTPLTLNKSVILQSSSATAGRMLYTTAAPTFQGGISIIGDNISLVGLEIRNKIPSGEILIVTGKHVTLDRIRVMGDLTLGQKRGIRANGADLKIIHSIVDDIFWSGQDSQAILSYDTPGPILIDDCFLAASGETVMFGGADPSSELNVPSDVVISGSTLTKKIAWKSPIILVKNALELKDVRRILIKNNIIEYSWLSGQTGTLLMITPRNQSGTAPYSIVSDVEVVGNTFRHGSGAMVITGRDDNFTSMPTARINIHNNIFEDMNPQTWGGTDKLISLYGGPSDVTIDNNIFTGGGKYGNLVYFDLAPKLVNCKITNNTFPIGSTYRIFGSGVAVSPGVNSPNAAFTSFCPGGVLTGNVEK